MTDERDPPTDVDRHAARRLLDEAEVLARPCDLDLAVFFARHPRSLLSSDSLSAFLGYQIADIADSLDTLIAAGLLRRRQTSAHAARLYELTVEHSSGDDGWLDRVMALASTRRGRLALLEEMARRASESAATPEALTRPGPRRVVKRTLMDTQGTKTG